MKDNRSAPSALPTPLCNIIELLRKGTAYRIIRAVMRYYAHRPEIDVQAGLSDQGVVALTDPQDRFNLVLAHYLAGAISLGRAAELMDLPWLDLRTRFLRLDVPLRTAPADLAQARADVEAVEAWAQE